MDWIPEPESYRTISFGEFCPGCPERNDLTDNADIKYCRDHSPEMSGDKDRQANPSGEMYYPSTNSEASDPGICDFIHRGIIASG